MKARCSDLKSINHIRKRADFLAAQARGAKWIAPALIVYLARTPGAPSRFGITVTKKVFPRAVDRNRVRRRLRAAACDVLADREIQGDLVMIARKETLKAPYDKLTGDLRWCLKRLAAKEAENKA